MSARESSIELVNRVRCEMRPDWRTTPGGLKWSPGNDALVELATRAAAPCADCGKHYVAADAESTQEATVDDAGL